MAKAKTANDDEAQGGEGAEAAAPPKRRFSLKMIAMVGGGVLLLGGGGYGAFAMLGHEKHVETKPAPKPAVFLDMPEVLVNLNNAGSDRTQYLKVKVVLEIPDEKLSEEIKPLMPRITDTFQTYLRELRPTDLDGSAGLYRLKEELTKRVNIAIAPNKVNAVLFKEIVVQ
jgi:flagellar FliL protein